MNTHPHVNILEKIYSHFLSSNYSALLDLCDNSITFQIAGKSHLAGKYNKANFVTGFANKLTELSGGTFKLEIHDTMATDRHAVVLASSYVTPKGASAPVQMRTVHVWRFEKGAPVAWYEYPRDLYQFDQIWG